MAANPIYQPQEMPMPQGPQLENQETIKERRKEHADSKHREITYGLRRIASDQLDLTFAVTTGQQSDRGDGRFPDMIKNHWEEGRHNSIRVNTHLQAKSLVFNEPEIKWKNTKVVNPGDDALVSKVRNAYYIYLWRSQRLADLYRRKLLDMLISGEGNIACWLLNDGLCVEYLDSLDVTWDPSYKEPQKRRYVFVDRHMPQNDALAMYPGLNKYVNTNAPSEKPVTLTLYYSNSTYAVMYGTRFISLEQNPYGIIPLRVTELFRELSVKHPTGMVELQIGTHRLDLRIDRALREIALRCLPVGIATGDWDESALDDIRDAEEGVIVRSKSPSATFSWTPATEIPATLVEVKQITEQQMNAESGVNDFQRGQTDTKVDFASQLAYIAQQSGVLGRYAAQQHEDGIREDAALIMDIASKVDPGPISLVIDGHQIDFGPMTPIKPLLGGDGEIILTPGGMEYKSAAQKIQEWMVLTQALEQAANLPPGIREHIMLENLKAFGVDDAEQWIQEMQAAQMQMMAQQAQMAMAQAGVQTNTGSPGQAPQQGPPKNSGGPPGPKVSTPQAMIAQPH